MGEAKKKKSVSKESPEDIVSKKTGILLDVGCRNRKEENFIGIDSRPYPDVDIVHDLEKFPYPIDDDSCLTIKAAHVIEHIAPNNVFAFMDELWRMLHPDGKLAISAPYAGSAMYWMDPSHRIGITERTWQYFDPGYPLYEYHKPKPWKIIPGCLIWKVEGSIEVVLSKIVRVEA